MTNFYSHEFEASRKCIYLALGLPLSIYLGYVFFLNRHPLTNLVTGVTFLSTSITFFYFFNKDIMDLAMDGNSEIGKDIRLIKNELVLYEPLSNPVILKENSNGFSKLENKYKF